jgi:transcriptional regulator with XRE-family HTH domain
VSFDAQCGDRLRQERDRLGHSQQGLAELVGVQRAMLSRYERGLVEPGAGVLMRLAEAGVDVSYVLFGARSGAARTLTPEEAALLDNYNAADERGRAAARSVLDALAQPKAANG